MPKKLYQMGTIAGDDPNAFQDKYHFPPHGDADSTLKKIWVAKVRADGGRIDTNNLKSLWEQHKTANPNYKAIMLAYRAGKIKEWNEDHGWEGGVAPVEESSSDDEDEDGVDTSLPEFMEGRRKGSELEKILEECPELVGEESLTPKEARAHARRLMASKELADEEIKKKAWAHGARRWAAYRANEARAGGTLRGGRKAVNAASRTQVRTAACSWTNDAKAELTTAVDEEETTPRFAAADQQIWERIASKVNKKVDGATYTWEQCRRQADHLKLLETELPRAHMFHPKLPPHEVDLDGLPEDVPRGRGARDEFMALPMVSLCWLMGFLYNMYIPRPREENRQMVVDALMAAKMCACDPNEHGVELPYLKTPAFTRANHVKRLACINKEKSHIAYSRAMGPASQQRGRHGGPISGSDGSGYRRLATKRVLHKFANDFRPRLGEHPTRRFHPEVIEYYTTCAFSRHDDFDADQDCAICGGFFIDRGGRVFCGYQRSTTTPLNRRASRRRHSPVDYPQASTAGSRRPASSPLARMGRACGATSAGLRCSTSSGGMASTSARSCARPSSWPRSGRRCRRRFSSSRVDDVVGPNVMNYYLCPGPAARAWLVSKARRARDRSTSCSTPRHGARPLAGIVASRAGT